MVRALGWLAFGVHVIALGITSLFCQLPTVSLLIVATVLAVWQVGTDQEHIGRRIEAKREGAQVPFRAAAYARLDLTSAQEDSMVLWNLFPHRSNESWWNKYLKAKEVQDFASSDTTLAESE